MISPKTTFGRWALTTVLLLGLGIGACEMPTETRVDLGKQITMSIPRDGHAEYSYEDPLALTKGSMERIESMPGVEGVNVEISEGIGGTTVVSLLLRGSDIPTQEILDMLSKDLEPLNGVDIDVSDLGTMLHEDWGSKIGRELFHVKVDLGLDDAELQQVLLQALHVDGQHEAAVDVKTQDGQRTITVHRISSDGRILSENEMTIELQQQ